MKTETKVEIGFTSAIIIVFLLFWQQSGWYRVDCALGIQHACALIDAEYVEKSKP